MSHSSASTTTSRAHTAITAEERMPHVSISTVTSKGQATIPAKVRKKLHLQPGDKVGFDIKDNKVILIKIRPFDAEYHKALSSLLSEWESPNDDEAYNDL